MSYTIYRGKNTIQCSTVHELREAVDMFERMDADRRRPKTSGPGDSRPPEPTEGER